MERLHDALRDREPQTGAAVLARSGAIEMPEGIEHDLELFGGDPRSLVGDFCDDEPVLVPPSHIDAAATGRPR